MQRRTSTKAAKARSRSRCAGLALRGYRLGGQRPQGAWGRAILPDDVLLFRYSALTFNGHRIHCDRKYVTEVEGCPSLIVHGPLIAALLMDLLRRHAPQAEVASFGFKAVRPTSTCTRSQSTASVMATPSSCGRKTTKAG